ncbi:hypothetical protein BXZ70DRAFT_608068 [Cristinia sonorae]|uniref:Uncharacterized protein n=1 Tax=Cristinia sonorae TaxID=1940300 RepID=A0A8K0UUG5_9AGAR|nr:hypothetical protein BXZ70DRAFT_608068 [Cristinia sonorae]
MPGPRNAKSRKKAQSKKDKRAKTASPPPSVLDSAILDASFAVDGQHERHADLNPLLCNEQQVESFAFHPTTPTHDLRDPLPPDHVNFSQSPTRPLPQIPPSTLSHPPLPSPFDSAVEHVLDPSDEHESTATAPLFKRPFIEDPGTGIRVRDMHEFLASRFAAPPSWDDEMCAEFAQEEVLQMLWSVLPEETALILWYNKSRVKARICPACQRLYRLGDVLLDPLGPIEAHMDDSSEARISEHRVREQQISGLCSPVCFILAAFNYPAAIRSTWGRMAEDISDETWELLDAPQTKAIESNDMGLGMLLKMTRCHDLGLGQLLFPDLDLDESLGCMDGDEADEASDESSADTFENGACLNARSDMWEGRLKEVVTGMEDLRVQVAQVDDEGLRP